MKLFGKNREQVTEPVLEEMVLEEDQLFEKELENVIAGVSEDFAREKLSELDQMMETKEPKEETESKQK